MKRMVKSKIYYKLDEIENKILNWFTFFYCLQPIFHERLKKFKIDIFYNCSCIGSLKIKRVKYGPFSFVSNKP